MNPGPPGPVQVFAVLDPAMIENRAIIEVLGTDVLPLESSRIRGHDHLPYFFFRVKVMALGEDTLIRLCRYLARVHGWTEAAALSEAVQGRGVPVGSRGCYVCDDPAIAHEYFARRERARRRGEA